MVSTTVIARTANGLQSLLPTGEKAPAPPIGSQAKSAPAGESTAAETKSPSPALPDLTELEGLSVVKLRAYVRTLDHYPMTKEEIRSARKQDLLAKIVEYYREKGLRHD